MGVTTATGFANFFKRSDPTIYSTLVPQNVWGLAASPSSDVFYTLGGTSGTKVLMIDISATVMTPIIDRTGSLNEGSVMAYDTFTDSLVWTERQPDLTYTIFAAKAAVNAAVRTVKTNLPRQYCIAVDDESVYWLNGGVPFKTAK